MTPQEALALPDGSLTRDEVRDLIDAVAQQERVRLRAKHHEHLQRFLRKMSVTEHALIHDFVDWLLVDPEWER